MSTINFSWIILLFAEPLRLEKNGNLGARILLLLGNRCYLPSLSRFTKSWSKISAHGHRFNVHLRLTQKVGKVRSIAMKGRNGRKKSWFAGRYPSPCKENVYSLKYR